jgi:alanine racemase
LAGESRNRKTKREDVKRETRQFVDRVLAFTFYAPLDERYAAGLNSGTMATTSAHATVQVDLARIRRNAEAISQRTGVELIAVVKADAYGLGADVVAAAIGDIVDAFYVFDIAEVAAGRLRETAERRIIALLGKSDNPDDYLAQDIHPVVWTIERAKALKKARPVLSVDTGQQRFGCDPKDVEKIREAGECDEIMTHATDMSQVQTCLDAVVGGDAKNRDGMGVRLHAAGSALLDEPKAWLDAVRPGLAIYREAARVSTRLVEVREGHGPAGYTGFKVPRFGLILVGYAHGLRPGPCQVNSQPRRVLEVGMQSSFVEIGAKDRVGDEVVLLGDGVSLESVAKAWHARPHEALLCLSGVGPKNYK